jgi:two-component system, cell cycle response regulator DivK
LQSPTELHGLPDAREVEDHMSPSRTVLIVEDDEASRDISATILAHHGFDVTFAGSVEEAMQFLTRTIPDAAILDLGLPETSGFELLAWIRASEATRDLPVIVATVHVFPRDRQRAIAAGCDVFLMKPLEPTRLVAELERVLAERNETSRKT